MKVASIVLLLIAGLVAGCGEADNQADPGSSELFAYQQYIMTNGQSPTAYVISKFVDHDVVFLGEQHRAKDHQTFIQELIPVLHANGVYHLATEFACRVDQPLIDSLLNGSEYDEALARHIQMNQYSLFPWQEYMDIFKAAWALNHSLPDDAPRFRILGMNCELNWGLIQTKDDLNNIDKRRQVWAGCGEEDWAQVILTEVEAGHKTAVHCGIHHAFTRYLQPIVSEERGFIRFEDDRCGRHVYEALGDRVAMIALHSAWYSRDKLYSGLNIRPAGGVIDLAMENMDNSIGPVGFDVIGTPVGDIEIPETVYSFGYDSFKLSDFCDGWIYFRPWSEFEIATFADGFYTDDNIKLARNRAPQISYRQATPEIFEFRMRRQLQQELEKYREL